MSDEGRMFLKGFGSVIGIKRFAMEEEFDLEDNSDDSLGDM